MVPKFPHVEVKLVDQDGNVFAILGAVQRAMRQADVDKTDIDAMMAEAQTGDYDQVLRTVMATVSVS